MSYRRYRRLLRSHLPIALACTLAASVGGCSTWRHLTQLASLKDSQTSCESDAWPTKVMASVHRAETSSGTYGDSGYVADYTLDDMPKEKPRDTFQDTTLGPSEPAAPPPPPVVELPEIEQQPPPPVVPPPTAKQPPAPEAQPLSPDEQDSDIAVVRPPEPAMPARPTPSPKVIEVCGPNDTACQDQVMAMLSDPLHKWIKEKPTSDEQRTGVRILAYRVLTPILACDDLRQGVRETEAIAAGIEVDADAQEAGKNGKSPVWVRLLSRAVKLELEAEIERRC